jgi:hypothetical protein
MEALKQFFLSLPRPVLVILILTAGLAFFMINEPPHTVCKTQQEIFTEAQAGRIFPKAVKGGTRPPIIGKMMETCRYGASAGSCFEYFAALRQLLNDLHNVPSQCLTEITTIGAVKKNLIDGVELIAKLAWGEHAPDPGLGKLNWLETPDVALFCRIKETLIRAQGEELWEALRLKVSSQLPDANKMSASDIWVRSLFSVRCEQF